MKEYWELFQGRLYITRSDKVVFKKSMTVCFKYVFGISNKEVKKKENTLVLKNYCEISRDNNHQSLYKSIKLYNDIELSPGPVYVNELPLS